MSTYCQHSWLQHLPNWNRRQAPDVLWHPFQWYQQYVWERAPITWACSSRVQYYMLYRTNTLCYWELPRTFASLLQTSLLCIECNLERQQLQLNQVASELWEISHAPFLQAHIGYEFKVGESCRHTLGSRSAELLLMPLRTSQLWANIVRGKVCTVQRLGRILSADHTSLQRRHNPGCRSSSMQEEKERLCCVDWTGVHL